MQIQNQFQNANLIQKFKLNFKIKLKIKFQNKN